MPNVDTSKVTDRRSLRFNTIDDLLADIDVLVAADKAGKLRSIGNWTLGQAFGHLASWIEYSYSGYPFKTPWLIRFILKFLVKGYIKNGMPAGRRIPNTSNGTYGTEVLSTDDGAARLKKALLRLRSEPAQYDSPAFGHLSDADRTLLNLRHAELHLSFFRPA